MGLDVVMTIHAFLASRQEGKRIMVVFNYGVGDFKHCYKLTALLSFTISMVS